MQAQSELMNSGLYLVLQLHLYEQRFAELMALNYRRASRERVSPGSGRSMLRSQGHHVMLFPRHASLEVLMVT